MRQQVPARQELFVASKGQSQHDGIKRPSLKATTDCPCRISEPKEPRVGIATQIGESRCNLAPVGFQWTSLSMKRDGISSSVVRSMYFVDPHSGIMKGKQPIGWGTLAFVVTAWYNTWYYQVLHPLIHCRLW